MSSYNGALKSVEEKRDYNLTVKMNKLTEEERENLIKNFHPDFYEGNFRVIEFGKNKGEKVPEKLAELLNGESETLLNGYAFNKPDYYTDTLVIGGGGAGSVSALEAVKYGSVILATKFRLGDGNTVMAEGGMQAVDGFKSNAEKHFFDTYIGGGEFGDKNLIRTLTENGNNAVNYLKNLGVAFDRDEKGNYLLKRVGGASENRLHSYKDCTGLEIMRVLKKQVSSSPVKVLEYLSAIEILVGKSGRAVGAVFKNTGGDKITVIRAKSVIVATGGAGRLYYGGFPTSNSYDSTADGVVICCRAGCTIKDGNSVQYHPTGAVYPKSFKGNLVTEKARSLGAKLVNANGEVFIDALITRDAVSSAIIKECKEGRGIETEDGDFGVFFDIPMIDKLHGEGKTISELPNLYNSYKKIGIDITKQPILVYPTLHYQNGGVKIDENAETGVKNLYAVGEVSGGIHGRNRLMGNSLLELVVFGKIVGEKAGKKSKDISFEDPSDEFLKNYYGDKTAYVGFSPQILPIE